MAFLTADCLKDIFVSISEGIGSGSNVNVLSHLDMVDVQEPHGWNNIWIYWGGLLGLMNMIK